MSETYVIRQFPKNVKTVPISARVVALHKKPKNPNHYRIKQRPNDFIVYYLPIKREFVDYLDLSPNSILMAIVAKAGEIEEKKLETEVVEQASPTVE